MRGGRAHVGTELKHLRVVRGQHIKANPVVVGQVRGQNFDREALQRLGCGSGCGKGFEAGKDLGEKRVRHKRIFAEKARGEKLVFGKASVPTRECGHGGSFS